MTAARNTPTRGRPRSTSADERILGAAIELVSEVGIHGMSMDELATRAGVSKATIYRRWSSKEELTLDALHSALQPIPGPDSGSLHGDLEAYLRELTQRIQNGQMNSILPHLIAAAAHDSNVRSSLEKYTAMRRKPLNAIFTRAVERNELPADADIDLLIDATIGPFIYRRLLTSEPLDDEFVERLVAVLFPHHQ